MEHVNLTGLDFVLTPCPIGTKVEIASIGKWIVDTPVESLFEGIAMAYSMLTKQAIFLDEHFVKRITVTELDEKEKLVKARIALAD